MSHSIILTSSEKLLLWRRRTKTPRNQIPPHTPWAIGEMERGQRKVAEDLKKLTGDITPTHAERCYIMRRRCRKTMDQVGKEIGKTKQWVWLVETGKIGCDELLWYWEQ